MAVRNLTILDILFAVCALAVFVSIFLTALTPASHGVLLLADSLRSLLF